MKTPSVTTSGLYTYAHIPEYHTHTNDTDYKNISVDSQINKRTR